MNAPRSKIAWRPVNGVLLLDKPLGLSSNDALQKVRRLFRAEKGGHTGTLDPLATGLLPLCFGEATKFSHDLLDADKTYETTLRLGIKTITGDAEGAVIEERPVAVSRMQIQEAISRFQGEITQIPPMYSALKKDGVPLYKLARQGIEIERLPRKVNIQNIEVLAVAPEEVSLRIRCSKGTYIRTLGEDIGECLGCGAHLISLRRVSVAGLSVSNAFTLEAISAAIDFGSELDMLASPDALVGDLPSVLLDTVAYQRISHGNPVKFGMPQGDRFRIYSPENIFLGVAIRSPEDMLQPQRLVRTDLLNA